ncbi:BMP family ABC transporter substrate-binding protein [Butyrivibrio sp. AE3004]|uniref:BMP family ABC transporter substrate-binding protein n=1 Tax=Butyrivibrio sp. AE3004 TaxID=1506994 RepID=UPI00049408A3|nr:BMP family ABC transporter substrate-binding protein [Butyrivibrio sp. AE3004]
MTRIKDYIGMILFIIMFAVLIGLIVGLISVYRPAEKKETKVGAVFIDDIDDGGWNENHYKGIKAACEEYGLKFEIVTNVDETLEACEPAVDELVEKGCNVIFLTSDGFGKNVYSIIEKYSDVIFYTISADSKPANTITYFARFYQMRLLSGMIAASMTQSNILGFVAATNNSQSNRGINAFLLGAREVNPDIVVKVRYIGEWTNAEEEREATRKLIEEDGADVIAYHASIHSAVEVAEEHNVYSIGYNNYKEGYSDKYLASIVCHWDMLYKSIISDFLKGSVSEGKYYWWGIVYDAVELQQLSPLIPKSVLERVDERATKLREIHDVFYGDLVSNDGRIMCRQGERISDDALLRKMDWYMEGVEIYD